MLIDNRFGVGTVAVMLMVVIVIRLPVRGLFFGQGRTKFLHPVSATFINEPFTERTFRNC